MDKINNNNKKINRANISSFILFFICILSIGILLFFNGFLLMRFELPLKSQCNQSPLPNYDNNNNNNNNNLNNNNNNGCWMNKTYNKAVIVVIDALRYDFVARQPISNGSSDSTSIYFHNRLTSIQNLIDNKPENSLFYKFVADSPTVTMQRIKGITTGSLPTFIDVGSNFGGDAIVEDSLVNQLSFFDNNNINNNNENDNDKYEKVGKFRNKVIFIGDDTWVGLFPNHFYAEYPYPSFNVKDIDTVDNGVLEHLLPTITKLNDEWDVAIAHLLGVDHVGHTYGPYHPEMIRKLNQMDEFLLSIINNIKNDTLFILMGDHGMTTDGNHGGASLLETEAALFMYSPGIKINSSNSIPKEILKSRLSSVPFDHYDNNNNNDDNNQIVRDISQIDLVSTLSLALGVPIPFGNLGSIIPELFFSSGGENIENQWNNLFNALRINTFQIKRYIEEYSKISKEFPISKLQHFDQLLKTTEDLFNKYKNGATNTINPIDIYKGYIQYHQEVIELCRNIWATFDLFSMDCGILLILLSIISIIFFIIKLISIGSETIKFPIKSIGISIGFGLIISTITNITLSKMNLSDKYSSQTITLTIPSIISIICFIYKLKSIPIISTSSSSSSSSSSSNLTFISQLKSFYLYIIKSISIFKIITTVLPIATFILHGVSFYSNSFIEAQQGVVYFFLVSNILLLLINSFKNKLKWSLNDTLISIGTFISLFLSSPLIWNFKFSSLFIPNLNETNGDNIFSNLFETFWVLPLIFILWRNIIFKQTSTISSISTTTPLIHQFLLSISLISISLYWYTIQPLISSNKYQFNWIEKSILPWIVYLSSIIGLYYTIVNNNNNSSSTKINNPVEKLLKRLVYICCYFYLVILLLLGVENSKSTLLMLSQAIFIAYILIPTNININNNNNNNNYNYYFKFIVLSIIFGFLSINDFFTSGHEYSFNKIQFESAFIGFENHLYLRDGLLVLLNTFSSPIFFTLSLPIVIIYTRFYRLLKMKQLVILSNTKELLEIDENEIQSFFSLKDLLISFLCQLVFYGYQTLHICISVYGLRRHLMVWRVFAPKYIFESIQLLIVSFFILFLSILISYFINLNQKKNLIKIK
ncbi:hypothetical protein ACTFIR_007906 [Dictyostelium discoideum]